MYEIIKKNLKKVGKSKKEEIKKQEIRKSRKLDNVGNQKKQKIGISMK